MSTFFNNLTQKLTCVVKTYMEKYNPYNFKFIKNTMT